MAIDPKELEGVRPASSAVDRLKSRKNRIKPWQTPTVSSDNSAVVASSLDSAVSDENSSSSTTDVVGNPDQALNAPVGSGLNAEVPPTDDTQFSKTEHSGASAPDIRHNTDTIPTQPLDKPATDNQHKADTKFDSSANKSQPNTDTILTQKSAVVLDQTLAPDETEGGFSESIADTKPAQRAADSNYEDEKNPVPAHAGRGDTIPTQNLGVSASDIRHNTDTKSTQQRHKTNINGVKHPDSRHKAGTKATQNRPITDTIPTPQPTQKYAEIFGNTDTKAADLEKRFRLLKGLQLQLLEHCARVCLVQNSSSFRATYESLALNAGIPAGSVRTTAKRLRDTGVIELAAPSKGRGAFIEISVPEALLKSVARGLVERPITDTKLSSVFADNRHNADTTTDTNGSSKLVSYINTTNLLPSEPAHEGFDEIDLSGVQRFGISRKHIQDIKNQKLPLTRFQLEEFISRFVIYASEPANVRNIKNFPALFISMIQLLSRGEDPLADVETPESIALRELLERAKRRKEDRAKLESELKEFEFEDWLERLSANERDELAMPSDFVPSGSTQQRMLLKAHFVEIVWPEMKTRVLANIPAT